MELAAKLAAFRLDQARMDKVRKLLPVLEANADRILAEFYVHMGALPGGKDFFPDKATIERAKAAQKKHWLSLFSDGITEASTAAGVQIGHVHSRLGVTPAWYVAGYSFVIGELAELANTQGRRFSRDPEVTKAVQALLLLDMETALSAYIGAENHNEAVKAAHEFSKAMIDGTINLSIAVNEAAISNAEMMKSMQDVEQSSQSMSAAVEELVSSIQAINASTQRAAETSRHASQTARSGGEVVEDAVARMAEIARAVSLSADQVEALAAASEQIGTIVETIEGIAAQTNLLALNATIEAARAGEAGKGFAVVANEVKSLSNQTSNATEEIRGRIQGLIAEMKSIADAMQTARRSVEGGSSVMQNVNEQMGEIGARVQDLDQRTDEISGILNEQSHASSTVSEGVAMVAQSSASNVQKTRGYAATMKKIEKLIGDQIQSLMEHDIPHGIVKAAKSDHVIWKKRLADMLVGLETLDPAELTDHKSCRLGKWYYSPDSASYRSHPAFARLEAPHKQVHEQGKEAARLYNSGNVEAAIRQIVAVGEASEMVLACLDELATLPLEDRLQKRAAF